MLHIYCNHLLPIWRRDLGILSQDAPLGEKLCCMCSAEKDELLSPLCAITGCCCLLLPLNSKFICRNTCVCTLPLPPTPSGSQSTFSLYQDSDSAVAVLWIKPVAYLDPCWWEFILPVGGKLSIWVSPTREVTQIWCLWLYPNPSVTEATVGTGGFCLFI